MNSDNDGTVTLTNVYDPQYNRGPADYDIMHTFSSSWVYEFPWARNTLYGGWQLNGILLLRGGLPFTVGQTQGVQSSGTGNRPNRVCDGRIAGIAITSFPEPENSAKKIPAIPAISKSWHSGEDFP